MPGTDQTASTLPSLETGLPGLGKSSELLLTIAFHPDTRRIGQVARIQPGRSLFGRERLSFTAQGLGAGEPLGERHVSRRALTFDYDGDSLLVIREQDSCRCRLDGEELSGARELTREGLTRGVPLLLSHSVLLWLGLSSEYESDQERESFGLLGSSWYTQSLRAQVAQAAHSDLDVLLCGATGTGKEVIARAIHTASARSTRPMVSVNVAAIPPSLAPAASA